MCGSIAGVVGLDDGVAVICKCHQKEWPKIGGGETSCLVVAGQDVVAWTEVISHDGIALALHRQEALAVLFLALGDVTTGCGAQTLAFLGHPGVVGSRTENARHLHAKLQGLAHVIEFRGSKCR